MMTLQKIVLLVLAAALALPLAAAAQPAPATAPAGTWNPDVFPISFWCGPPKDFVKPERFKQIADAGFTYCMPPCGPTTPEMNKQILDDCQQAGIKAFIADSRMPIGIGPNGEGKEKIDAIVADYKDLPALAGYHITDEPWGGAFPARGGSPHGHPQQSSPDVDVAIGYRQRRLDYSGNLGGW